MFYGTGGSMHYETDPEEVGEELPELIMEVIIMSHIIIWMTMESR